jgi:hypothetical protein
MASGAASDAADAQTQSAREANATQLQMYNQTREDNAPFRENGLAANNRLSYLLGLNTSPYGSTGSVGNPNLPPAPTRQQIFDQYEAYLAPNGIDVPYAYLNAHDKAGRDATVDRMYQEAMQQYRNTPAVQADQAAQMADPAYGSLLRNFSASDLNADPVYQSGLQFALSEGEKGINNQAAASGNMLSGATLKALTRFGNDYSTSKAGDAYNRYNNNRQNTYNMLSGAAGGAQVANNNIASAGQNMANQVSQNQIGVGNARAASSIGGANAIGNSLSQGYNMYQGNRMMDLLANRNGGGYGQGSAGYNSFMNNADFNGFGSAFTQSDIYG